MFNQELLSNGIQGPNLFAKTALESAYFTGDKWLEELLIYLRDNYNFLKKYLLNALPKVKILPLEATYLVWIDFSEYLSSEKELNDRILNRAGVGLDYGSLFSKETGLFQRINIACPKKILKLFNYFIQSFF